MTEKPADEQAQEKLMALVTRKLQLEDQISKATTETGFSNDELAEIESRARQLRAESPRELIEFSVTYIDEGQWGATAFLTEVEQAEVAVVLDKMEAEGVIRDWSSWTREDAGIGVGAESVLAEIKANDAWSDWFEEQEAGTER